MAFYQGQRNAGKYPMYPGAQMQQVASHKVSLGGGNLPRFGSQSQYQDEAASVSSQMTYPSFNSQSDLHLALKSELSEFLRSFTALSSQHFSALSDSLHSPKIPALSPIISAALNIQGLAATGDGVWSKAVVDIEKLAESVQKDLETVKRKVGKLRKSEAAKCDSLQSVVKNIEEKLKKRHAVKVKRYKKAAKKRTQKCQCLWEQARKLKKTERSVGTKSGKIVCKCK